MDDKSFLWRHNFCVSAVGALRVVPRDPFDYARAFNDDNVAFRCRVWTIGLEATELNVKHLRGIEARADEHDRAKQMD